MNLKQQLFTPDEAFVRGGQTRQAGCLIIVSPRQSYHLFLENGFVIHASTSADQGQRVLDTALNQPDAFYTWIPDYAPSQKTMNVSVPAFSLKNAVAKDVHIAATGKTLLSSSNEKTAPPANETFPNLYLVPKLRRNEKFFITNPTVILGRDPSCDIVVQDTQVSRRHCLFQKGPKGISFRDLDSTNGVRVNGISVREGLLGDKDKLELGTYVLDVCVES
jgi:hypothetical protein